VPADSPKKDLLEVDAPALLVDAPEPVAPSGLQSTAPRPTVIPTFDPLVYAKETEQREQAPTITNEVELEQARVASMASLAPPPRARAESLVQLEVVEVDDELDALDPDAQVAVLLDRLAPLARVPTLVKTPNELAVRLEDSKAAYIAGFVDGLLPLETIVDVAGLPQLDTLRVLDRMIALGLAVLRDPS
jgi:hypothetical protein